MIMSCLWYCAGVVSLVGSFEDPMMQQFFGLVSLRLVSFIHFLLVICFLFVLCIGWLLVVVIELGYCPMPSFFVVFKC